jgi:hypothetical protein
MTGGSSARFYYEIADQIPRRTDGAATVCEGDVDVADVTGVFDDLMVMAF